MKSDWVPNRRVFLACLTGAGISGAAETTAVFPSEMRRYADVATEFVVLRLTDPANQSLLPASYNRAISRRNNFLIYSNDRSGKAEPYRMDLKTGESRLVAETEDLRTDSLTLTPDERGVCYQAGRSVFLTSLAGGRVREVYRASEGFELGRGFGLSEDGLYAALVERKAGMNRLRLITMRTGTAGTLVESNDSLTDPIPRPRRASLLYRHGNGLALVNFDGAQNRALHPAAGTIASALWSSDGRAILYLSFPSDPKQLHALRELTPDTNEDRFVSATSQFVTFNRNADSSVLVGASGSQASPYILLLVRSVKRELTLCEHRSSDPERVTTFFSPNSQRIFFQSDRDGKMAIYSMAVDRLVEETETDADQ